MKRKGRAAGGRGESAGNRSVQSSFLRQVDVWAVTHLLTCLGGAASVRSCADGSVSQRHQRQRRDEWDPQGEEDRDREGVKERERENLVSLTPLTVQHV